MLLPNYFYWFRIDIKHMPEPWLDQGLMDSAYRSAPSSMAWWRGSTGNWRIPYIARLASSNWFEWILTLETVRIMYSSQGRLCHLCLWSCLRLWFGPPQPVSKNLKNSMSGFRPVLPHHNTPSAADLSKTIPSSLSSCPMVFIRQERHIPPLAPLF